MSERRKKWYTSDRAQVVADQRAIWRTYLLHACLGYVSRTNLVACVADLLGFTRAKVCNVVQGIDPTGCYDADQ
jgi:hypothetical protein